MCDLEAEGKLLGEETMRGGVEEGSGEQIRTEYDLYMYENVMMKRISLYTNQRVIKKIIQGLTMVELLPNQCLGPILINAQKWAWWHLMAHPSIREGEAGGTDVQGHPQLHSEFKTRPGYMDTPKSINLEITHFF